MIIVASAPSRSRWIASAITPCPSALWAKRSARGDERAGEAERADDRGDDAPVAARDEHRASR